MDFRACNVLLRLLLPVLLAILSAIAPAAGSEYFTVAWDADDGLPHNGVNRISQTSDGYLWLATSAGLARFDGFQFHRVESSMLMDHKTDSIRELGEDSGGRLLVAPDIGGVAMLGANGVEPHPLNEKLHGQRVASLYLARDGSIWFSLIGGALSRWKDGHLDTFGKFHHAGSGRITMAEDSHGGLWLGVGDFLGRWQDGTFNKIPVTGPPSYHITPGQRGIWVASEHGLSLVNDGKEMDHIPWAAGMWPVYTMLEQSDGTLWLGTTGAGIFRLQGRDFVRGPATHPDISSFLEDREGNLWVGTRGGGIYRLRERFARVFDSRAGLPQDVSFSVCQTDDGTVWFANRTGGLVGWDGEKLKTLPPTMAIPSQTITVVSPAPGDGLYVGTEGGLFYQPHAGSGDFQEVTALQKKAVRVLYTSRSGDVWVATRSRTLGRCNGIAYEPFVVSKSHDTSVNAIGEDAAGRLIVGTIEGELFRADSTGFSQLKLGVTRTLSSIVAIAPQTGGSLWVGTSGDGILHWKDGSVRFLTRAHGLPDNAISQMLWQDDTHLWVGSRSGIWRLNLPELENAAPGHPRLYPLVLGRSDGLSSASCIASQQPACCRTRDGCVWFATRKGVVRVDPGRLRSTSIAIPVHIEDFRVDGVSLPASGEVRGFPQARKYDFDFTGVLLSAPDRLQFRYRLDGFDSDWVDAGQRRQAVYSELSPGTYHFAVQARGPAGIWTGTDSALAIIVPPTWWQRLSVQISLLVLTIVLLIIAVRAAVTRRFRQQLAAMRQRQALENERSRIARDLHDELGAGLTQLGHLGHFGSTSKSPDELRESLADVSRQARNLAFQMDAIVWTVNPKNDSLPQLAGYLAQFGQEFFRSLPMRLRVDRPEHFPDIPVTPEFRHHLLMSVKEAFNNVAKHSEATEVWLRLSLQKATLNIEIADNGRGFEAAPAVAPEADGLLNMQARAKELCGRYEIASEIGKGTTIRLVVPLPRNPN